MRGISSSRQVSLCSQNCCLRQRLRNAHEHASHIRCEAAASTSRQASVPPATNDAKGSQPATALDANGTKEYNEMKHFLLSRTRRYGMLLTLYVLLVLDDQSATCCAVGAIGSWCYTYWLCHDIDRIGASTRLPIVRANAMQPGIAKSIARVAAGLQQAAQPRLLVPVLLAASAWGINHVAPETLTSGDLGSILCGFLAHKIAHIDYIYQNVKLLGDSKQLPTRPQFDFSQHEEFQYDRYGRPRSKPRAVQEADDALAAEQEREARKPER